MGVDLGAGSGAKIGLFSAAGKAAAETVLPASAYGDTAETLTDALAEKISAFLDEHGFSVKNLRGVGLAAPGLFRSDGSYLLAHNLSYLNDHNLKTLLAERLGVPVGVANDADAGGLAEGEALRTELLYWVLGGGWGGAWVSKEGTVRFPSLDWDGDDASLHPTNEPGYAVPLKKRTLAELFRRVGASYERFEEILREETRPADGVPRGPSGDMDTLRAEAVVSGPGRLRLFRAVVGEDRAYESFLEEEERRELYGPAAAGRYLDKLSRLRVEAALTTDRLFGRVLAEAARHILTSARADGCPEGVPICLGGKPSYALPFFGPAAQEALCAMGFTNYLRPAVVDERGGNANLIGAAVLAERAAAATIGREKA